MDTLAKLNRSIGDVGKAIANLVRQTRNLTAEINKLSENVAALERRLKEQKEAKDGAADDSDGKVRP